MLTFQLLNNFHERTFYCSHLCCLFREGNGTPLQYSCLENPNGWRSLVGYSPWGCEESDATERLPFHFSLSCIGEGNGSPLQCSCLENPRDRGAWWAAVHGVAQSRTRLKRLSSSSRMLFIPVKFSSHWRANASKRYIIWSTISPF